VAQIPRAAMKTKPLFIPFKASLPKSSTSAKKSGRMDGLTFTLAPQNADAIPSNMVGIGHVRLEKK
jgi:hypothetical protein